MESIVLISGKVKYSITLDPSVWIFDDRKQELHSFFHDEKEEKDSLEEYTKEVSKHWDREIIEGAIVPPTLKTEKKFIKEELITGTFCIPFEPFLKNAEVLEEASHLIIISDEGEVKLPLEIAEQMVLGFSIDGKPLREDGPVHCYYGDGSNFNNPIRNVKEFRVE
ncbi:peptidyl-prolyl cis-trans isomerase [Robertmurraya kyonggiensis]|uniref:Peptidyl-prolyl cis-trans isomerase n=1 Tax=Robertmurraya kyonggiensis TaxID=1037680 RepID=A0A4U1D967_9BACI|nr:peptidyl-prolyl cis-trans isomerase [Robertmurraya kyonggiensis]TKC18523.1 peptidyl-prolyl cis-trans isomerase [Robertmurraya kyonggiensis]